MFSLRIKFLVSDDDTLTKLNSYYKLNQCKLYIDKLKTLQKNDIDKNDCIKIHYENIYLRDFNSGLDIISPNNLIIPAKSKGFKIPLGIACEPIFIYEDEILEEADYYYYKSAMCGYYLYPRSSLSKTPLRLANSVGIIDPGYRGELMAAVDNNSDKDYEIKKGQRLFQLCSPSLEPINYILSDELTETERGTGGFGSTGE